MAVISYSRIPLKLILAIIVAISFVPFLAFFLISLPLRCFVKLLAKLFRPDLGPILNGMEAFLSLDCFQRPKYNLVMYFVLDGLVPVETFQNMFEKNVIQKRNSRGTTFYPELRQSIASFLGYSFRKWERDFKLSDHVREYDYHAEFPLGNPCEEEELRGVLGGLMSKGWKKDFSPWEFLVIPYYRYENSSPKTCFIVRIHHIMGDGHSITNLIVKDFAQNEYSLKLRKKRGARSWVQVPKMLLFPIVGTWQFASNFVESFDSENCWHTKVKLSKEYYTSISAQISLDDLKAVKGRHNVSISAVLFTALCGAIRRVMEEGGQVVPETFASFKPIPIGRHPPGLINYMSFMYFRWPLAIKSPIVRLQHIEKHLRKQSRSSFPLSMFWLSRINGMLPCLCQRFFQLGNLCTGITSLYPTPPNIPYLNGYEVLDSVVAIPLGPGQQGLSVMMMGTGGKLRIVASIDKVVSPPEEVFRNLGPYCNEELQNLCTADLVSNTNAEAMV